MNIITAPENFETEGDESRVRIFLAGSIEMGKAEKWQDVFIAALSDYDVEILNPRREHFPEEEGGFKKQVEWEQRGLAAADIIALYFDPATESPISLLELGLFAHSHKIFVCCPRGFWKKGNVDIICDENAIPRYETLAELIAAVSDRVKTLIKS